MVRSVRAEEAVGFRLCHDMTCIVPEKSKGARFQRGHTVREEDIPVLLAMGKEHILIDDGGKAEAGMLHENDGAARLAALCMNSGLFQSEVVEGKIELSAARDGLFLIDRDRFNAVNAVGDIVIAARHSNSPVHAGDKVAGTRVTPLFIEETKIIEAENIAGGMPLFTLLPYTLKTAAVIVTGNEVASGKVKDAFIPLVAEKLARYGITVIFQTIVGDGVDRIGTAIAEARGARPGIIFCTGGMSVDPDDNTPGAIRQSGANIVTYGAPLLPGAMFLLGYYGDGVPVCGLPGGAIYKRKRGGVLDIVLPRIAAGVRITKQDFVLMGEGGYCLGCPECRYPVCPYGK
ncbi:MAG: molybdopterin-binding protein [Spirochaetaceae bacterium]|jgi:hypothetical protein|nr:molybdopterin-binding protein [Spirochaetaceae bacterium]